MSHFKTAFRYVVMDLLDHSHIQKLKVNHIVGLRLYSDLGRTNKQYHAKNYKYPPYQPTQIVNIHN